MEAAGRVRAAYQAYDGVTIWLHWTTAALVLALVPIGLVLERLPFPSARYDAWHMWHRSLGELVLLLVIASLWWRDRRPSVLPWPDLPWRAAAARWIKRALFALLVLVPAVKILRDAFGIGWAFFGLKLAAPFAPNVPVGHVLSAAHEYGAYALAALALLHAGAALWHAAILHDGVVARMWPARRRLRA